jgi:hypothetical protein
VGRVHPVCSSGSSSVQVARECGSVPVFRTVPPRCVQPAAHRFVALSLFVRRVDCLACVDASFLTRLARALWPALGVRDTFGPSDFVGVLATMARETNAVPAIGSATSEVGADATRLSDAQLELAVAMVQKLSDSVMQASDWDVYVPDDGGLLAPSTALVFDDAPWIIGSGSSGGEAQMGAAGAGAASGAGELRFVHPKISNNVAQLVGVTSLRRRLLATNSEMLSFSVPAEAFGQSESLTRRLRHILELYVLRLRRLVIVSLVD